MSDNDVDAIWEEIERLRDELNELKVRREALANHANELKDMHGALKREADRAERLAKEVEQALQPPL